ncbi:MAG: hypothetical protein FJ112_01720 [Deltaproteobacteria bacterium]|nr:hypothetical protein [Deltaproteobacteria bacterium]
MNFMVSNQKRSLIVCACLVFLLFFRARWAFNISYVDETCYLESLHKLLGLEYPGCYLKTHLPGVVLSWVPVATIAGLLSWLSSYSFDQWLMPLLGLFSFGCWVFTLLQLDTINSNNGIDKLYFTKIPWLFSLVFLLNIPVLDFATQLTTMAHATELAVAFLVLRWTHEKKYFLALLFTLWLSIIRLNDIPILFVVFTAMLEQKSIAITKRQKSYLNIMGSIVTLLIAIVAIWLGFFRGHANMKIGTIASSISLGSLKQVLISPVESLLLYLPVWSVTLILGLFFFRKLSWTARAGLLWMILIFLFNAGHRSYWKTDGPHFRFFIGSFVAVLQILFEFKAFISERTKTAIKWLMVFGAIWYSLFVWSGANAYIWTSLYLFKGGFTANYMAYDGTSMPAHLRKLILEPIGLSPIVFSLFSMFPDVPIFSSFSKMQKYTIHGCSLYSLALASLVAVATFFLGSKRGNDPS